MKCYKNVIKKVQGSCRIGVWLIMSELDIVYPKEDILPESNTNEDDLKFKVENNENELSDSDTVLTLKMA